MAGNDILPALPLFLEIFVPPIFRAIFEMFSYSLEKAKLLSWAPILLKIMLMFIKSFYSKGNDFSIKCISKVMKLHQSEFF